MLVVGSPPFYDGFVTFITGQSGFSYQFPKKSQQRFSFLRCERRQRFACRGERLRDQRLDKLQPLFGQPQDQAAAIEERSHRVGGFFANSFL